MQIGLDIGSTTVKIAVLDDAGKLLFSKYARHASRIMETIKTILEELAAQMPWLKTAHLAISGSAGIGKLRRAVCAGSFCRKNMYGTP